MASARRPQRRRRPPAARPRGCSRAAARTPARRRSRRRSASPRRRPRAGPSTRRRRAPAGRPAIRPLACAVATSRLRSVTAADRSGAAAADRSGVTTAPGPGALRGALPGGDRDQLGEPLRGDHRRQVRVRPRHLREHRRVRDVQAVDAEHAARAESTTVRGSSGEPMRQVAQMWPVSPTVSISHASIAASSRARRARARSCRSPGAPKERSNAPLRSMSSARLTPSRMRTRSPWWCSMSWWISGWASGSAEASRSQPRPCCWLIQRHSSPGPPAASPPPAPPHVPAAAFLDRQVRRRPRAAARASG